RFQPVGNRRGLYERRLTGRERRGERRCSLRLDADYTAVDSARGAGGEATPSDRPDDRVDVRQVLFYLQPERPVARLQYRVVEGGADRPARFPGLREQA